jgi:uncharacterized protein YqeY
MIQQIIQTDKLNARKTKNKEELTILTTLLSEIEAFGKTNGNRDTTEDEAIKIIQKFKKNAEETMKLSGNKNIKKEISIYDRYLPTLMTTDELKVIITNSKLTNIGEIMKYLNQNYKGKFDGKEASIIAKTL